jgi:hypothetical protein
MARKILGIADSLRGGSYNKAVLRTLAEQSWEGINLGLMCCCRWPVPAAARPG